MPKLLLFNGSPHPAGNTAQLLEAVGESLHANGIETQTIQVGGQYIRGCVGCRRCAQLKNGACVLTGDPVNEWLTLAREADGFLIGSPVYTANVTAEVKALIDRFCFVAKGNDFLFRGKVGAPVVVGTKAGMLPAYQAIHAMMAISQMVTMGSIHWNLAVGKFQSDVQKDAEGLETMRVLGENLAWLVHALHGRAAAPHGDR